jgi:hypothetical protein
MGQAGLGDVHIKGDGAGFMVMMLLTRMASGHYYQ